MKPDFSGYATKADIKCTDGRVITAGAFAHQDKIEVPLVWQHGHDSPANILGHAVLEHRAADHPEGGGIYCEGFFNDTEMGVTSKALVHHKDVKALSIFATGLVEKVRNGFREVMHGDINEVSLVIKGANRGAFIDNVQLAHSNGDKEILAEEAVISAGLAPTPLGEVVSHADAAVETPPVVTKTATDIFDEMTEEQQNATLDLVGAAIVQTEEAAAGAASTADTTGGDTAAHSATQTAETAVDTTTQTSEPAVDTTGNTLTHTEGDNMSRNLFDTDAGGSMTGIDTSKRLKHSELVAIVDSARKSGSFKEAVLEHAGTYGINDIELLFPDAKALTQTPEWISRRMEWVSTVLGGTKHSPFAKVKTLFADITAPEARAKGYIKGNRKEEEVFGLLQRTTGPATIYKKQKLDRDDLLDITDMNVVAWLKGEMRLMIEEEVARAILVGDNRSALSPDKVKDPKGSIDGTGIRSILHDDDLYAIKHEMAANVAPKDTVKAITRAMIPYKGTGTPTMFISRANLVELMLEDDKFGRPLYADRAALADKFGVSAIVTVDLFDEYDGLYCIIVSLVDYTVGTNAGGELTPFEDFDIDFNQYKYLQETRLSGGLTRPFSALVVKRAQGTSVTPTQPSFDGTTKKITVPEKAGVVYLVNGDETEAGQTDPITETTEVEAVADDGYYFPTGTTKTWTYNPS